MAGPEIAATIRVRGLEEIQKSFAQMQANFERSAASMRKAGERVGEGVEKSMKGATVTVRTTGTVGARSFNLIKGAAGGLISILKSGVSLLARIGKLAFDVAGKVAGTGTAAFLAVQAFGITTGKSLDELGRLADAAGVPVERFSRLATATRLLGGDMQDLSSGMSTLSEKVIDAAKDAEGSGAKAFKQLGIQIRDAEGNIKSTERLLSEVADGLAAVPSKTLRASAAVDIFGGSAAKLLPLLENGSKGLEGYAKEADRLGTVVTDQQTKTARGLLVQYRKVTEALRGIAYKIADHLLPFLTQNSNAIATYLAENGDSIAAFAGKVLREIAGISADLGRAIAGDASSVQREWVRKLVPAMTTVKNVVLDLLDIFAGGAATRAPWLKQVGESLRDAGASALALGQHILKAAGFGDAKLPSLQEAATAVAEAFASLRAGITGQGEVKVPWAENVGKTMTNLGVAIGVVAGIIVEHREEITSFAADATFLFTKGMEAIQSMLSGNAIAADNPFAFLNEWKAEAKAIYDGLIEDATWLKDQVVQAYETIGPMLETLWGYFDSIAKSLGFNNGGELAIVLFVAHATGLLDIVSNIAATFAAVSLTVNNLAGTFGKIWNGGEKLVGLLGKIGKSTAFRTILTGLKAFGAALLAIPASVAAIGLAIAALVVLAYIYCDEIKWAAGAAWDWIVEKWDGLTEWIGGVFDAAKEKVAEFWDWLKAAPREAWGALVEKWEGFKDWIAGVFDSTKTKLSQFWDWLTSAPGRAWDGLVSVWSGFGDFFRNMISNVTNMFANLWDGVKNGASDAWNSVKGWFGLGEDEGSAGTADLSPRLRTGGIIRGAGSGTSDSIRAWLSNGEGVINARAVRHYGEGFVHALNALMLPQTHFATGGIVGDLVPAGAGRASGLSDLHLNLLGQRTNGGIYADADGMRGIKRDLRKVARASRGPAPRWRGY